ncbi:unnamed protein product [Ixodes persulcatus]
MTFREIVRTATTFGLAKRFLKNQTNLHLHPVRAMSTEAGNVIAERVGNKGVITLDRPKALNALSLSMIRQIYRTLEKWHADPGMKMVIIKADKDSKAFSVGGDVKAVVNDQDSNLRDIFFREVYILNNLIANLTFPYVALLDGVTIGGAMGLFIHGTFQVATERTVFAMPETAIGYFPDVGSSYVLPRLPGKLGLFLGLTGRRLVGWEVFKGRIATHFSSSQRLERVEGDLMRLASPNISDIGKILQKNQDQVNRVPQGARLRAVDEPNQLTLQRPQCRRNCREPQQGHLGMGPGTSKDPPEDVSTVSEGDLPSISRGSGAYASGRAEDGVSPLSALHGGLRLLRGRQSSAHRSLGRAQVESGNACGRHGRKGELVLRTTPSRQGAEAVRRTVAASGTCGRNAGKAAL